MFYTFNLLISKGGHKPLFMLCIAANNVHLPQPSAFLAWVNRAVLRLHAGSQHVPVWKLPWNHPFFSCCVIQIRNSFVLNNLMGACCNMERAAYRWLPEPQGLRRWSGGGLTQLSSTGSYSSHCGEIKKSGSCYVTLKDWNILCDKVEQDLSFGCECNRV